MSLNQSIFGGSPFQSNGCDIEIANKANPGLILNPVSSETASVYCAAPREINGSIWYMQNADYNGSMYIQPNQAIGSTAFVQLQGGGIATYSAPAGSPPGFTWTRLFYVDKNGVLQSPGAAANPYFYVGDYDGPTDGVSDAYPAWLRAYGAAVANGAGVVLFGPFNYNFSQMPEMNSSNVNVQGMGQGTTTITPLYATSSSQPAGFYLGPACVSSQISQLTVIGPGLSATGTLPGPTTVAAPALGTGWGIVCFGGKENLIEYVSVNGFYHGILVMCSSTTHVDNCVVNMGGAQTSTQYGIYVQGPLGSPATTGNIVFGGSPVGGSTTFNATLNDAQGNIIVVPTYTATSADNGNLAHFVTSVTEWLNNSDAVQGPLANWNSFAQSTDTITGSIDILAGGGTPTFDFTTAGGVTVSPNTVTSVTGGTPGGRNPVSQVIGIQDCTVPQASATGGAASTEAVHIDGGVTTVGVVRLGTTGCAYGIRLVNQNSGSDHDPHSIGIQDVSFDHTRVSGISHENGGDVNCIHEHHVANFGQGPPPQTFAHFVGSGAGTWSSIAPRITSCDSGGFGISGGSGVGLILSPHIDGVGRGYLSPFNFIGSGNILGLTIKDGKLGAADLSSGGEGSNAYAIDFVGPGSPTVYTGTFQSLTIQNVDMTGAAGSINRGTIISGSITANALNTYITIDNNPGNFPLNEVTQPSVIMVGSTASIINPFVSRRYVLLVPDGSHAVTAIAITNSDATTTRSPSLGNGVPVTVSVGATESLAVTVSSGGTLTWFWF